MRRLNGILAAISMLSSAVAVWLWLDLRDERARNLALQARVTATETAHEAPAHANDATLLRASVAPPLAAKPSAVAPGDAPVAMRAYIPDEKDILARQRKLMSDPKYRDAWHQQRRAVYALRRDNLVRVVGLTTEQADAVLDLQIDREQSQIENYDAISDTQAQADDAADQQRLRELLGEEKSRQLQKYMESRATRMRVDDFRSELSGADALREDQVEPLIDALHAEDARMRQEMDRSAVITAADADAQPQLGERQLESLKAGYERMHSAAAPILTSSQIAKFDAMLKRDLDRRIAEQRVNRIGSQFDAKSTSD